MWVIEPPLVLVYVASPEALASNSRNDGKVREKGGMAGGHMIMVGQV